MKNISFDNPYWLLIAIPLLAAILIPYFISANKDNRTKGWIASLVIHALIIVSIALAAAGLVHTTVMTRTKLYVVADVSYSSERNLDEIDEYVKQVQANLPPNTMMGLICFGKDAEILSSAGTEIKSVKESKVDDSATNLIGALEFVERLFGEGEIKRIVLITDGRATTGKGSLAATVTRLVNKGIKLDTIYLDNNLGEDDEEIQISDVDYTHSTYLDHDSTLKVLIESSVDNDVIIDLYSKQDGETEYKKIDTTVFEAGAGMNIATLKLPTDTPGTFDYKVEISGRYDVSPYNNTYCFTQKVVGQRRILLVTEKRDDVTAISNLYGDMARIDSCIVGSRNSMKVPYTIESLMKYDEIILSNVDIRKIDNVYSFINSVDLAVSQYGKSLITLGDMSMQTPEKSDELVMLEELLPVSFGNANKDSKLYTIVIDISRSMYHTRLNQLIMAKEAATKLVSLLEDDDYVAFITLAGEAKIELTPTKLSECREELYAKIQSVEPSQGTFVGEALDMAYRHMKDLNFEEKQVMLISDGKQYKNEATDSRLVAEKMYDDGINLSTISVLNHGVGAKHTEGCLLLEELAELGGGTYYDFVDETKLSELIFSDVAEDITESVIETKSKVNIEIYRDDTVDGILTIPEVYGYINSKAKLDATMVLSVDYQKSATKTVAVPLYSYRDHGNGRVATFTSSLTGDWLGGWDEEIKNVFFGNILTTNTPVEQMDYPFNVNVESVAGNSTIEIIPSSINPRAKATIMVMLPDGSVYQSDMNFDLNRYRASLSTPLEGRYMVEIIYTYGDHSFVSNTYFTLQYADEYDAFGSYDIANIYDFMRGIGRVSRDGNINLENAKNEVDTYKLSFRLPLLVIAAALFIADVIVRKFKWSDIKGLFTKKRKENLAK